MNKSSDVFETEGQSFQCYEDNNGEGYYDFKKFVDFIGFSKSYKRTLRNSIFKDYIVDINDKLYISRKGLVDKLLHRSRKDIAERMSKDLRKFETKPRKREPTPEQPFSIDSPNFNDSIIKETRERLKNIREELRKERKKREASESKTKNLEKEIENLEQELESKLTLEN